MGATEGHIILTLGSYIQFRYWDKISGRFRYDLATKIQKIIISINVNRCGEISPLLQNCQSRWANF